MKRMWIYMFAYYITWSLIALSMGQPFMSGFSAGLASVSAWEWFNAMP